MVGEGEHAMWRLKYLLIGMIPPALLGVALYFVLPEAADALRDAVRDSAQNTVQRTFEDVPATVQPGRIEITALDLEDAINGADRIEDEWNLDDLTVVIDGGLVSIRGSNRDRSDDDATIASARPEIRNGRFILTDRHGLISIFKPARDAIADEIEAQVEQIFENSNVRPVSLTAEDDMLVIVTEALGGNPTPAPSARTPTPAATRPSGSLPTPRPTPTP
jgi:hypothetical protein